MGAIMALKHVSAHVLRSVLGASNEVLTEVLDGGVTL